MTKCKKRQSASRPTAGRPAESPALAELPNLQAPDPAMGAQEILKITTPGANRPIQSGVIGTLEPNFSRIKFVGSDGFRFIPICRYNIIYRRHGFANPPPRTQAARPPRLPGTFVVPSTLSFFALCHFRHPRGGGGSGGRRWNTVRGAGGGGGNTPPQKKRGAILHAVPN